MSFDLLGSSLAQQMKDRHRGPARRSNPFSLFEEMTPEQMQTYTPSQLHTILCQRQHVRSFHAGYLIACVLMQIHQVLEVAKESSQRVRAGDFPPPPILRGIESTNPWVPPESEECRFKCCVTCRPSAESRSFLSLDGVMNGEIPPAAATGFGFHRMGTRPIIDLDVLKNIGLRPVPLVFSPHLSFSFLVV